MTTTVKANPSPAFVPGERVTSVDFFRGMTMFLLMGESTELYSHLTSVDKGFVHFIGLELSHHEWHGLHFWDLIQPFFMFIVGVAIPFAVANREKKGASPRSIRNHALKRSLILLLLGWGLYNMGAGHIVFKLQNVLAQLSVTYLVAFLIMRKSFLFQLIFSVVILLLTDLTYRFFPLEGFNRPWEAFHNFGAWMNIQIEGTEKTSIWATINAIPTIAHTVWGVLCGQLLMSKKPGAEKVKRLALWGMAALIVGYTLDWTGITPIIKKIATASFVFASGGWAILGLAFSYWLIDVQRKFLKGSRMFIIVGTNSIFIYMLFSVGCAEILSRTFTPFVNSLMGWTGQLTAQILTSLTVWSALWYICYWLYKNKIFIKI
jgi:predicted acyltransferase